MLEVTALRIGSRVQRMRGEAKVEGQLAADAEIMRSQLELASAEGLYLEASSAITLAVLPELVKRGEVGTDSTVVLLGTSSGLKDVHATAELLPPVTVIDPSLDALDAVIGGTR